MQSSYIFSNMCTCPVCIKFENPLYRRHRVLQRKMRGETTYKMVREYSKGLPTDKFKLIEDNGLPSAKHLVPTTKVVGTDTFVFNEPLPETCDTENFPFPSELYYHTQDFPHIDECLKPLFQLGKYGTKGGDICMYVPCGKCAECVQQFKNEVEDIVVRDLQACKNPVGFFITLTYDQQNLVRDTDIAKVSPEELPEGFAHCNTGFLHRYDLQCYIKRLRITLKRWYDVDDVRIIYCGEYGKNTIRPHYHILIWFESTEKTRLGYFFHGKLRGKMTLFMKYIKATHRVPKLNRSVMSSISYNLWRKSSPLAHRVEIPRNNLAVSRYICKYLLKTKFPDKVSHLTGKFAPTAIPCFFRISNNIGTNCIPQFTNAEFLKRGTIFREVDGQLLELPLNPRLMRKVSRHLFKLGFTDYYFEREQHLKDYIFGKLNSTLGNLLKIHPEYSVEVLTDPLTGCQRMAEFKEKYMHSHRKTELYINNTINQLTNSNYE